MHIVDRSLYGITKSTKHIQYYSARNVISKINYAALKYQQCQEGIFFLHIIKSIRVIKLVIIKNYPVSFKILPNSFNM